MTLPLLPAEHIPSMLDALDERANNDHLDAVMAHVFNTLINSRIFPVECWFIFMKSVRTIVKDGTTVSTPGWQHEGRCHSTYLSWNCTVRHLTYHTTSS
ncbi:hypothetical protein DPMN_116325 [Dreissena polymorpha]|uniref:Uncharacterized protein n=1 Tax=Dreissena polymorpha TaxID=45954 RepID=A0A9D4QTB6_DREPO|nr:hypothetical protein DPMN_116325 [Dreissena polymorpha]